MNTKQKEIKARKDSILAITVGRYISTVAPVSSSFIVKEHLYGLSSATIRNILAELEHEGYLTHPHTSAGRIPTQKGYRYYVDNLMNEIQLLEEETTRIKIEYKKQKLELEELFDNLSKSISETTHYTSMISVDGWDKKLFCRGTSYIVRYLDYTDIQKIEEILAALDEKERLLEIINRHLEKRIDIFIGNEMACAQMNSCSLVISEYKTKKGPSGRIAVLGPTRMNYERVVSAIDYFSSLIEEIY
ncbi:MAG: hypothetical protein KJ736_01875 [Candidatus Omnitrophica bacterium]|nr:hypothetical protein [Candidatus Omnitrophota bacterium]